MPNQQTQYDRKVSLVVYSPQGQPQLASATGNGLDLSQMHFKFNVNQDDKESPSNAVIRVYNLSPQTVDRIRGQYSAVILQAGYVNGPFGVIFKGTIKQYRIGKENATDKYLDILAADGDLGYNFGVVNATLAAGSTHLDQLKVLSKSMGLENGYYPATLLTGRESLRGKTMFAMSRDAVRDIANSQKATWSIQNGQLQLVSWDGYLPGEAVVINSGTGMVDIPQLTEDGLKVSCLLNPKLSVGGLIKIDNKTFNQTVQQNPADDAAGVNQTVFDKYKGFQRNAAVSADGLYRCYVIEYSGDTRGQEWFSNITALAVNSASKKVDFFGGESLKP